MCASSVYYSLLDVLCVAGAAVCARSVYYSLPVCCVCQVLLCVLAGCCAEPSERRRLEELASRQGRLEGGGGELASRQGRLEGGGGVGLAGFPVSGRKPWSIISGFERNLRSLCVVLLIKIGE